MRDLRDVCAAVETTVRTFTAEDSRLAREVLTSLRWVLASCDQLSFDELGEALAYLLVHHADRYLRTARVLERLFQSGELPLGKTRLTALDVGAGPGPGIFAICDFYSAICRWAISTQQPLRPLPVSKALVIERGRAMARVMHQFGEQITAIRRPDPIDPCLGVIPFGPTVGDFAMFDLPAAHHRERAAIARELVDDYDLSAALARQEAYRGATNVPSAVALCIASNFLTTSEMVSRFRDELTTLSRSLVPGGVLIVMGSASDSAKYRTTYQEVNQIARNARLSRAQGSHTWRGWISRQESEIIANSWRRGFASLEHAAGDPELVRQVKDALRLEGATDLYDDASSPRFASFRGLVFRRQDG